MSYYLGVDAGSSYIKLILIDDAEKVLTRAITPRGSDVDTAYQQCFDTMLSQTSLTRDQITAVISTGYGRRQIEAANEVITEIAALALGAYTLDPDVCYVIDVGGQDSKVIALNSSGKVLDFVMNHKCAAGTGRFLEVTSASLGVPVEQLGPLSRQSENSLSLSSTCTVFAESEIISCVAQGQKKEDIIRALHRTISNQILGLFSQVHTGLNGKIAFVGGLALNVGLVDELSEKLQSALWIPDNPQWMAAFGAAVFLKRKQQKKN